MTNKIDAEAIRQLAKILAETGLSEIEYEHQGSRIYIAKATQGVVSHVTTPLPHKPVEVESQETHPGTFRSPMVGTVYLSPEPGATPFVHVGCFVETGQTLLIVEAMKVMNPIKAAKAGKVTKIFVHDSKPVEYDEPLLILE